MADSAKEYKVQLGCGTLIIIALIVMFFSGGRNTDKVQKSVDELQMKVDRLEQKIDALSEPAEAPPQP